MNNQIKLTHTTLCNMRFLFKSLIFFTLAITSIIIVNFNAVPFSTATSENIVQFSFSYNEKSWNFNSNHFKIDSDIFTITSRINETNNLSIDKRKILINKLINAKIPPKIIINYLFNNFDKKIIKIAKNIEKTPKNAEIIAKNSINIKKEIIGIKINYELLYENILNKLLNTNYIKLNIDVIKIYPSITYNDLKKEISKRGQFETNIASSTSARKHNIKQALKSINGTKISPNEKFSFNKIVGRRTTQNGYREAKIIINGEFVEGLGGGVCQVSTTLYNAILLSGLKIISSQKHSQRVGYVKGGFDAMVNYGSSDLIFENNTNKNIYILCKYLNTKIRIEIYGESLGATSYSLQNEIVDKVECGAPTKIYDYDGKYLDKVKYTDETYELKRAKQGYTIKSYRVKKINDEVISTELLRIDKYSPQNQVLVYGTQIRPTDLLSNFINISNTP